MRRRQDFELAVRRGHRARGQLLTAYLFVSNGGAARDASQGGQPAGPADRPAASPRTLIGFVVSRVVGTAVVRNRVRRRLRHLARARAELLPAGSLLVIRADPRAADARQRDLAAELDLVLAKLLRRQVRALDRP
jgi:ribonuclease P protein component